MDHVFLRGNLPPKSCRPHPSIKRIDPSRFYAHRRTLSEMVFLKLTPSRAKNRQIEPIPIATPRSASRLLDFGQGQIGLNCDQLRSHDRCG
jgi:hypothetical protein